MKTHYWEMIKTIKKYVKTQIVEYNNVLIWGASYYLGLFSNVVSKIKKNNKIKNKRVLYLQKTYIL